MSENDTIRIWCYSTGMVATTKNTRPPGSFLGVCVPSRWPKPIWPPRSDRGVSRCPSAAMSRCPSRRCRGVQQVLPGMNEDKLVGRNPLRLYLIKVGSIYCSYFHLSSFPTLNYKRTFWNCTCTRENVNVSDFQHDKAHTHAPAS